MIEPVVTTNQLLNHSFSFIHLLFDLISYLAQIFSEYSSHKFYLKFMIVSLYMWLSPNSNLDMVERSLNVELKHILLLFSLTKNISYYLKSEPIFLLWLSPPLHKGAEAQKYKQQKSS